MFVCIYVPLAYMRRYSLLCDGTAVFDSCVYACMHVCMYACVYVCTCMRWHCGLRFLCVYVCRWFLHHAYIKACIHIHTRETVNGRAESFSNDAICRFSQTYIRAYSHIRVHTRAHTHTRKSKSLSRKL
jgi:hypothetical protein